MSELIQPVPEQPERKRSHWRRWLIFGGISLVVLLLLAWFLLSGTTALDGLRRSLHYFGKLEDGYGSVSFESYGVSGYSMLNDGLAVASQGGVTLFSEAGETVGKLQRNLNTPILAEKNEKLLLYDVGGTTWGVINKNGKMQFEQITAGTIFDADLAENHYSAVLYAGEDSLSTLEVYDDSGVLLYRLNAKSNYLNTCALSPNGEYVVVTALGQEEISFSSLARVYRTDSEEMAVELPLGSQVVYDMAFLDNETICAIGTGSVVFFNIAGERLGEYAFEDGDLTGYSFDGEGYVTLSMDLYQTGSRYLVVTLQPDGTVHSTLQSEVSVLSISASGSYVAVLTAQGLCIYDDGLQLRYQTQTDAVRVLVRADGTAFLIGSGSAELYIP